MELLDTGVFLIIEWVKTFFIFTIIDRIFMGEKIINGLKNQNNYILSLLVASFLIIARTRNMSIFAIIVGIFVTGMLYSIIKKIRNLFINV
ncbi:MAG: hypothetical protein JJT76_13210 [Clostridiaceae bacterium]|nr:hypothetical protein [Clostridiaceae bacterium]